MDYYDAMEMYGTDKPDLRCDLQLIEVGDLFTESSNDIFREIARDSKNNRFKALCVPNGDSHFSRKNLSELKLGQEARIEKADALIKVKEISTDTDVVFVDAPYANAEMGGFLIDSLSKKLKDGALVIWEQEVSNFALPVGNWVVLRDKTYGRARFLILQLKNK